MRDKPARLTTAEKKRIIDLRVQGYSLRSIVSQTGRSITAVSAVLRDHPVEIAELGKKTLAAAQSTFDRVLDGEWLGQIAARQTLRLINQCDLLQTRIDSALSNSDPEVYSQLARASAAISTALATLAKTYSLILPMKQENDSEQIPELTVRIMTAEDVAGMREQQRIESQSFGTGELHNEQQNYQR